ncbi:MAG: hypothetical protein U0974_11870 [Gemmatimonadales bacterium]|nr:hypothetical protein [Gemmatimonadales bacterium]MDZ4390413.1 hypothetical protein [Gemmatimonadales bacterium]
MPTELDERTSDQMADAARAALAAHHIASGGREGTPPDPDLLTGCVDLMADVMHLVQRLHGFSDDPTGRVEDVVQQALRHYLAEASAVAPDPIPPPRSPSL